MRDTQSKPEHDLVDSALRDGQVNQLSYPQGDRTSSESQTEDNFKGAGQAECLEDVETQGQTEGLEDIQINSLGDEESECSDANSESDQLSDDIPAHQKKWGKSFGKKESEGKLSGSANKNFGGVNSTLAGMGISPKLIKLCRRRLAALVGDASSEYSPRRDYSEFCTRLKTFRNPNPARKEESGRPVILIMADVSGSCSSFSEQSVAVAKAASKLGVPGSDVLVLTHSNGYPQELEHNGKSIEIDSIGKRSGYEHKHQNTAWYNSLLQKYAIAVAISLGDWDAADDYLRIAQHPLVEHFIWLDNAHCSSRGTVKDGSKKALDRLKDLGRVDSIRHKLIYRDGCKDAKAYIPHFNLKYKKITDKIKVKKPG